MPQKPMMIRAEERLKQQAQATADRLGISLSAVICNELRRFVKEQHVTFCNDYGRRGPYRTLKLRLANRDFNHLMLRGRREGLSVYTLAESILKQQAEQVPSVHTPLPPALPSGHVCDKCAQPLLPPAEPPI